MFDAPQRRAVAHIAAAALSIRIGERLPNIVDIRTDIGVGAGTVQTALRQLQAQGVIQIDTQKRRGTFLVERDTAALWRASELGPVIIAMPLPSAWEFYGLAAGLQAEFERLGVPISLIYAHGSTERLQSLVAERASIVVMSAFAAEQQRKNFPDTRVATHLPAGTYYARDSVLIMSRNPLDELPSDARIGIDPNSIDHASLTRAEFPDSKYVEVGYAQLPLALRKGVVDAAVWHRSALWLSLDDQGLKTSQLTRPAAQAIADATSPASLIVKEGNLPVIGILRDIDLDRVVKIQSDVVEGVLSPG
jgi:hypothetical protein